MDSTEQAAADASEADGEAGPSPEQGATEPASRAVIKAGRGHASEATNNGNEAADTAATAAPADCEKPPEAGEPRPAPHVQEISQQNIKNRINEVITEIEREVERELDQEEQEHREDNVEAQVKATSQRKLSRDSLHYQRRSRFSKICIEDSFDESDTAPAATPPPSPEPAADQSEDAVQGQGQRTDQSQPATEAAPSEQMSGVVADGNSGQSETGERPAPATAAPGEAPPEPAAAEEAPVPERRDRPAEVARFSSPFASSATSSLPRGWSPGGGTAFAVSGQPQRGAPAAPAAAPAGAPPPRGDNATARGWTGAPACAEPPKRVHFAEEPEVQTLEERGAPPPQVARRAAPAAPRAPRPLSAPAAAQLFSIPNMAARPYGRTSPLLVTAAVRTSPLPLPGADDAGIQSGSIGTDESQNHEMSQESEPAIPPPPPSQTAKLPPARIFTPADDDQPILPHRKKTMFVDSAFFSPKMHPTWEQQVEMAKKISASLSDASNKQSRGQSMYERRKKRSVKWIHQGGSQSEAEDVSETPQPPKDKPLLQLVMNPHGHVYDLNALKKQGWIIDSKGGLSPDICSDLIKDLNSPNGKGAQIFAKRKKRAEKWVVDETHKEARRTEEAQTAGAPQTQPSAPQPTPSPQPPPPAPAAPQHQLPPVQLKPVPLQSLYQPSQQPSFPSGGVYAPRTAHSWTAAQTAAPPAPPPPPPPPEVTMRQPPASLQQADPAQAFSLAERQRHRQSWANYNTAARGWGNQNHFYRPVTFAEPLLSQ